MWHSSDKIAKWEVMLILYYVIHAYVLEEMIQSSLFKHHVLVARTLERALFKW